MDLQHILNTPWQNGYASLGRPDAKDKRWEAEIQQLLQTGPWIWTAASLQNYEVPEVMKQLIQ